MKRTTYCITVAVVLITVIVTSAYAQAQRSQVRARRSAVPSAGTQSMQSWGGLVDPNLTPQQQMAQRQQEVQQRMAEMERMTPQQRMAQHQQEFQQRMAEMQRQMKEMQRQAEESRNNTIRQVLNATDDQWRRIEPKLDQIDRLRAEAGVSADPGPSVRGGMSSSRSGTATSGVGGGFGASFGFGGGATVMSSSGQPQTWTFGSKYPGKSVGEVTDGQVLCEQLIRDLQTPGTPPADIVQRVAALRKIRAQAQEQLAQTRKDLRTVIAPAQESALVAMGYLD